MGGIQERRSIFQNGNVSSLEPNLQFVSPVATASERLGVDGQDQSTALAVRKRKATETDSPEDAGTVAKKQKASKNVSAVLKRERADNSQEVGEFLESLVKDLEGSRVHGQVSVRTEPFGVEEALDK